MQDWNILDQSPLPHQNQPPPSPAPYIDKPRVVILTDIDDPSGEPDDMESLIRTLVYSNEMDIEGIIANTGYWEQTIGQANIDRINSVIDAYENDRNNLLVHASGYPTADYLRSVTALGQPGFGMAAVGAGKSSEGSKLIENVLNEADNRPVWFLAWGGCNTLAQALYDGAPPSKVRLYDIAGQDDAAAWIAHNYPEIMIIRSNNQFQGFSGSIADQTIVSNAWVRTNVKGHGSLGALYPELEYSLESDTPSMYFVLTNGLVGNPETCWYGCWGGRYTYQEMVNPLPMMSVREAGLEDPYMPFFMHTDEFDTWYWEQGSQLYVHSARSPIARWRYAYQNDMECRMDWCKFSNYSDANHNPKAVVNGDATEKVIYMNASAGSTVNLDASSSSDPDGDDLSFRWFIYPEPSTYKGNVSISNSNSANASVSIPHGINPGEEIHVILEVKDDGKGASLYSYRRVVLRAPESTPPASFDLTTPPDGTTISVNTPTLKWEPSSDDGSGLDHYEVWLDGTNADNVSAKTTIYTTRTLTENLHEWKIVAVDEAGNERQSESVFSFTVKPSRKPWFVGEDNTVGLSDLMTVAYHYGESESSPEWLPAADVNGDGSIGLSDLMTVAYHYGEEWK